MILAHVNEFDEKIEFVKKLQAHDIKINNLVYAKKQYKTTASFIERITRIKDKTIIMSRKSILKKSLALNRIKKLNSLISTPE